MTITPTTITTEDQIYLASSPINLRLQNLNKDNTISSVVCELYIWRGNLNEPPEVASYTLKASKVSKKDNYINFEISDKVASHITNTRFSFNAGVTPPSVINEGVFFAYKNQVTNENATVETAVESVSNFATNGYRFDFEQIGDTAGIALNQPYLGLFPINYNRNYTDKLKYYKRYFDFTQPLISCTSENIISSTVNIPTVTKCQLGNKFLIVYINRLGLFDYFTPFGKVVKATKITADTNPRLFRNPRSVNNNINHSAVRSLNKTEQTFVINSGYLNENMVEQVEDVMFSPLIYLIEFTGEIFTAELIGVTVDSTLITVDDTTYTVDNQTVTTEDVGYYSTFKQIPVTNENNDILIKTRLNDKGKINYDLSFKSTTDKINNVR